jgi:RNA-binding protein
MEKEKIYKLKNEASKLKPIINVGKNGITDSLIDELKKQIKVNRLVKIKMLKTSSDGEDTKVAAQQLAEMTKTTLIDVRGNTVVLYR